MNPAVGDRVPDFALPDTAGGEHSLLGGTALATVVVFTCNHCPYALAWQDRINDAARDYADRGVRFLAINSNDAERYPRDSYRGDAAAGARRELAAAVPVRPEPGGGARLRRQGDPRRVRGGRRRRAALPRRAGRRLRRPVAGRGLAARCRSTRCSTTARPSRPRPSPSGAPSSGSRSGHPEFKKAGQ